MKTARCCLAIALVVSFVLAAVFTASMPAYAGSGISGPAPGLPAGVGDNFLPLILKNPIASGFTLYNLSDAAVLDPPDFDLVQLQAWRSSYCTPVATADLTLAEARQNAWSFLVSQIGQANVDGFRQDTAGITPEEVQAFAIAAMAVEKPEGALAAFLVANELEPTSGMSLVNAAGMLTAFGFFNEAVAFLDASEELDIATADPMGISGPAIALNNRGRALNGLGRYSEAEALLNQAVQLEPELAEARLNLANALLCQNRDTEALGWYIAGQRRRFPAPTDDSEPTLDLAHGRDLLFATVPIAPQASRTEKYSLIYEQLMAEIAARKTQRVNRVLEIINLRNQQTVSLITQRRFEDISSRTAYVFLLPELEALWQRRSDQSHVIQLLVDEQYAEMIDFLADPPPDFETECRRLVNRQWGEMKPELDVLYSAYRDYAVRGYYEQTARAANLADPLNHEEVSLGIENDADTNLSDVIRDIKTVTDFSAWNWDLCHAAVADAQFEVTAQYDRALSCPPLAKGVKLNLRMADAVNLGVDCEIVTIGIASPGLLGYFAQLSVEPRTGNFTIFAGAKAGVSIGPTTLSVKEGFYVRGNRTEFTDVGMKVSSNASLSYLGISGNVEGPGFEFGVADAVAYWNHDSH